MLPGLVAGHYSWDEIHIDLARLAAFANARFIADEVVGLDLDAGSVVMQGDRPAMRFDVLSINTGGVPGQRFTDLSGVIPVKPIGRFLPQWDRFIERYAERRGARLAIVGGGPGSVELALAIAERYAGRFQIALITADDEILRGHVPRVADIARRYLSTAHIDVVTNFRVAAVDESTIGNAQGDVVPADAVVWVTGVEAPAWPRSSGLAVDANGFIQVNATLQSTSHPNVFAAGDIVELVGQSRPKSGVYAVREGPYLAANLRRYLLDRRLRQYTAQKHALALLRLGAGLALGSRGGLATANPLLSRWKHWIDRRFMSRFTDLPEMDTKREALAPSLRDGAPTEMRCGGCGAKLAADLLERVIRRLPIETDDRVVQGIGDDAAVVDMGSNMVVTSCDSFRAMITDPYRFGRIAAHHALNDLFAMGAEPRVALALATVPPMAEDMMAEELFQMMSGALSVFTAHGVHLVGGHSAEGLETTLGFTVTGAAPQKPMLKSGMRPGDQLVLNKPIGTGVLLAGAMQGLTHARYLMGAVDVMDVSNAAAADILRDHGAVACTDVTGFGLVGHLSEMTRASNVSAVVQARDIPLLPGALTTMHDGVASSLQDNNERALADFDIDGGGPGRDDVRILADPQTAGGLLAAVPADAAAACLAALKIRGYVDSAVIGEITDDPRSRIRLP